MRTQSLTLEEYWPRLASVLPDFPPEQQQTAVTLYRALAKGTPLSTEAVAQALGVTTANAAERLARNPLKAFVYADQGLIAGFGGLATAPMHHELRVKDRTLGAWCHEAVRPGAPAPVGSAACVTASIQ